jgi:hypothetical protein
LIPYWLLFAIPAWRALAAPRERWGVPICVGIWLALTVMVGLRHEVGGDWETYLENLDLVRDEAFSALSLIRDPAYVLLNWLSWRLGFEIYGVNFVCAGIFAFGLVLFCRAQPRPWLALCLSIPYLVIVVAMGYTRQAVSIGFLMPGFLALARGNLKHFTGWVTAAAAFQQTSLVTLAFLLPVMPGRSLKTRVIRVAIMTLVALALAQMFLAARLETFINGYIVSQQMQSEGAAIRVAMNALPAVVFLLRGKVLGLPRQEYRLWQGIALLAMACVVGLKLSPSTTVVDRLALYAIPLQLFMGSRIPDLKLFSLDPRWLSLVVVGLAAAVQLVWLVFAKTAFAWLPYQSFIWVGN